LIFHKRFPSIVGFSVFVFARSFLFESHTNVFLSAKAETVVETRHVFHCLPPCCKNPLVVLEVAASSRPYDTSRAFMARGHRLLADRQYQAARVQPKATLAEHLEEFEELWEWIPISGK